MISNDQFINLYENGYIITTETDNENFSGDVFEVVVYDPITERKYLAKLFESIYNLVVKGKIIELTT